MNRSGVPSRCTNVFYLQLPSLAVKDRVHQYTRLGCAGTQALGAASAAILKGHSQVFGCSMLQVGEASSANLQVISKPYTATCKELRDMELRDKQMTNLQHAGTL